MMYGRTDCNLLGRKNPNDLSLAVALCFVRNREFSATLLRCINIGKHPFADEVVPEIIERVAAERLGERAAHRTEFAQSIAVTDAEPVAQGRKLEREGHWGMAGGLPVADRPRAVALSEGSPVTSTARDNHRNLVAIHDHLRAELEQIGQAVRQVAERRDDARPRPAR